MDAIEMTKDELEQVAKSLACGLVVEDLPSDEIVKIMTIGQYLADRGLAEIERRGELEFQDGDPVMPYCSDYMIETILTRSAGQA
ncbi:MULTISPECIES: hypothetical protein [unclassified Rhizobium]|uniref:hypothetical protein n=1 Tax=unclassified Rhizobium TaxID=2613769 RepID=UPI002889A011|nr:MULTISPECIES: hypothetical protein [unclassified Rhizobium]